MPDKSTSRATHSRWPVSRGQFITVLFATLMVVSLPSLTLAGGLDSGTANAASTDISPSLTTTSASLTATTTTTSDNATYYDDFEDGDSDGWNATEPSTVSVVDEGFYTNNSLRVNDSTAADGTHGEVFFDGGPEIDMSKNFELSGTVKMADASESRRNRIGISGPEGVGDDDQALLVYSEEYDAVHLATNWDESPSEHGEYINGSMHDVWTDFRMQIDNGHVRAKVWESGTDEPEQWQMEREFTTFEGRFFATAGNGDYGRNVTIDHVDLGGHAISGQVVDQTGSPVPNATVEGIGVNSGAINDSIEDKQSKAEELLAEAQEVGTPDSWDPQFDIEGHYQNADYTYLLAHEKGEWDTQTQSIVDDPQLGRPKLQFDPNEEIVLSLWDPTASTGFLSNQIDGSFPGATTDGKIVIEQYSATGEVIDDETYETTTIAESSGSNIIGTNEYPGVETSLSTGFYKVYPEGNEAAGYTIMVGDADEQYDRLESHLETEAGQLTESAKSLRSNVEAGLFERRTTTANETGHFTLRMQTGVQRAAVQAYRADGTVLTEVTGPSFSDLRDAAESGEYNGTFHIGAPERHAVPSDNVTVQTYRTDTLPMQGIESYADLQEFLRNQRLNETISKIQSEYDRQFAEMNRSRLEATYQTHRPLVETVPGAKERYLERSEFDSIQAAEDLSNDELAIETGHMQTALANLESFEPPEDAETAIDISDGELNAEYPIPDGIDEDTLQPEIHWSDGTSVQIDEEYWSIDSGGLAGQNTLVIEGYPIESDDPAAFDLRILGGGSGGVLDDRLSATNPAFGGTIPDVRAIDVSTTAPGDHERVSMTFRPGDDSSFERVESVEVFGPEGQQIGAEIKGDDSASFTTDGVGEHFIRATVTDDTGSQFVQSFSIRALDQGRNDPPTVRAEKAVGDRIFAIAGDGLDDAEIRAEGDTLEVDAVVPGGEIPGSVHVQPQAAMDGDETDLEIQVLEGSDEAVLSTNVETVVHLDSLPESSRVWRGEPGWFGQALERDGGTRYGEVMTRADGDKTVIRTYTNGDGNVRLTIDSRDGLTGTYDSYRHGFAASVPKFNLPLGLGMAVPAAGGATAAGVVVVFSRRRYNIW